MPEKDTWLFTITFLPHYRAVKKFKLIEKLPQFISSHLSSHAKNVLLTYSIEYHKLKYGPFAGQDDSTAPHIHGKLVLEGGCRPKDLQAALSKKYGRTQFFLKEVPSEIQGWTEYFLKDVQRLNEKFPSFQHLREVQLFPLTQQELEEVDYLDLLF